MKSKVSDLYCDFIFKNCL